MSREAFFRRVISVTALSIVGMLLLGTPPAGAVPGCSFVGSTVTVTTGEGESATIDRGGGPNADQIRVGNTLCGGATVLNTDTILWNDMGAGGGEKFSINLNLGGFAPGLTDEPGDTDEIEFDLSSDLQVLSGDRVIITGTIGVDVLVAGDGPVAGFNSSSNSVNLNADGDPDLSLFTQDLVLNGSLAPDTVSAGGGFGTGGPFDPPVTIVGGSGNDRLTDGDNNDEISGDEGNDRWILGLGVDGATGDAGFDTIDAGQHPNGVEADLAAGFVSGSEGDSFSGFEAFDGTPFGDVISGGGGAATEGVVIRGKQGNDTITGTDFADLLLGGRGDDTLRGRDDTDTLRGNDGDDTIRDSGGDDLDAGGGGNDLIRGGDDDDTLRGQGGMDNLAGGDGDDILNGGTGTDTCNGGSGTNAIRACEL